MAVVSQSQRECSRFFLLTSRKVDGLGSFSLSPSPWSSQPPLPNQRSRPRWARLLPGDDRHSPPRGPSRELEMSVPGVSHPLFQGFLCVATCESPGGYLKAPMPRPTLESLKLYLGPGSQPSNMLKYLQVIPRYYWGRGPLCSREPFLLQEELTPAPHHHF